MSITANNLIMAEDPSEVLDGNDRTITVTAESFAGIVEETGLETVGTEELEIEPSGYPEELLILETLVDF